MTNLLETLVHGQITRNGSSTVSERREAKSATRVLTCIHYKTERVREASRKYYRLTQAQVLAGLSNLSTNKID
jgi:hypothetical protein